VINDGTTRSAIAACIGSPDAGRGDERSGTSRLMEEVVERET